MTKIRTIRITLDIDLAALPREEWEEEIDAMRDDEGNSELDEASDDWSLEELSTAEVAMCVEQATYNPEMFAGSMLYLEVAETRIVSHQFVEDASLVPPTNQGGGK
jgi:hypothetical protein